MMFDDNMTFEEGMEQLAALVEKLESGALPLDESLKAYNKSITISKHLKGLLDEGEMQLHELISGSELKKLPNEVE